MFAMTFVLTELMFAGNVILSGNWLDNDKWNERRDGCFYGSINSTENNIKLCKEDFGFMGWKQWTTDSEEKLLEESMLKIVNPSPNKILVVPYDTNLEYDVDP